MDEILNLCASFLLKLTLAALGAVFSAYIIPYLKEKKLYGLLKKLVSAAEKLALSCAIPKEEKKSYVISRLREYGVKVTPFVEALIEAAVLELDMSLGKNESQTPPSDELTSDARPYEQNCDDTVGETAAPHPKDAAPHPSLPTANPPSPEGEGTNRLLPREKLSAELTDEGFEDEADVLQPSLEEMVLSSFDELCDIAPTLTAAELLGSEDIASIGARLRRGYSLRDAYLLSQIKLHGSNDCSHLLKTSTTHRASTHLPDDVLAAYSIFMPKASRAEIQKNYTEYLARTGKS